MKGTKVLGLVAVAALLAIAAPAQQAQAMSLSNPGAAATVQQDTTKGLTTEVRWHWHHHHWHHHWHHWHRR